jgi:hypothetical protein
MNLKWTDYIVSDINILHGNNTFAILIAMAPNKISIS